MNHTLDELLESIFKSLKSELPKQQFNTWIKPIKISENSSLQDIRLSVPNRFILQYIKDKFLSKIIDSSKKYLEESVPIRLVVAKKRTIKQNYSKTRSIKSTSQSKRVVNKRDILKPGVPIIKKQEQKRIDANITPLPDEKPNIKNASIPIPIIHKITAHTSSYSNTHSILNTCNIFNRNITIIKKNKDTTYKKTPEHLSTEALKNLYDNSHLNPNLTFKELVLGRANDLAHAAAKQVAERPGKSYNPLFIYGGVGLGKTHLLQAIGNEAFVIKKNLDIRYIHSNSYYADVVKAYQHGSFDQFARYYSSLDLLLIDDIQFFNNKSRTQEEFFHAFNSLIENNKQIVITCDTYPKDIAGLSDRLISRFDWGLTVAIEQPEPEMRVAILCKKAASYGIHMDENVALFVARNLKSNVRELEGALNKILAYSRFHNKNITLEVAKESLKDLLNTYSRRITIELIQQTVAEYYKIKPIELNSKKRTSNIVKPRQIAMMLSRELTPASLPAIGAAFGNRDHTTVMHACRHIISLRKKDPKLNHDIHVLLQVIRG